jgi:hypothetical protein
LFFGALTLNLTSTNSQIRKLADLALCKLYESVNRQLLLAPLLNAISFQTNVRLKPQLIDHLSGKNQVVFTFARLCSGQLSTPDSSEVGAARGLQAAGRHKKRGEAQGRETA